MRLALNENKLLIFDYDGVLVDSLEHNLRVVGEAAKSLGYDHCPNVEYCRSADCISFESWARSVGVIEESLPEFLSYIHSALSTVASSLSAFPALPETIETLSERHTLAIITANVSTAAANFLSRHGLNHCFADILGAERAGSKSEKIFKLAEKLGYGLTSVYYIGDAGTDVQQGRAAGVTTVAVTWGYQGRERLQAENPDYLIDSPKELLAIVAE